MTIENQALSLVDVKQLTSLSKTTIYRLMKEETFPKPIKITSRRVAWRKSQIDQWLDQK